jgi:hypothetical protein
MDVLENKTERELYLSLLAEVAKASNELKCASKDINKVANRLQFTIAALNELINRQGD